MAAQSPEEGGWRCKRSYCKAVNNDSDDRCWKCTALNPKLQSTAPQQSSSLHPPTRADTLLINLSLPSTTLDKSSDVTPILTSSDSAYESASSWARAQVVPEPCVGTPPLRNQPPVKDVLNFPGKECRIVLIGKTGNGKSTTGNTILNLTGEGPDEKFLAKSSWNSVTKQCQWREGVRFGVNLKVLDTPGFFDTNQDEATVNEEIARCVGIISDGPHAVLLVIKLRNRFTKEEEESVEQVRQLFGDDIMRHLIILFTYGDMTNYESDVKEFREHCPDFLKQVMQENRYVVVNNIGSLEEKERQVRQLLLIIQDMLSATGGLPFTNPFLARCDNILMTAASQLARLEHAKSISALLDLIRKGLQSDVHLKEALGKHQMETRELQRLLEETRYQVSKIQTELQAEVANERTEKERILMEKMRLEQDKDHLMREKDKDKQEKDKLRRQKEKAEQKMRKTQKEKGDMEQRKNAPNSESKKRCNIM